jgi:hypothetical protein
MSDSKIILGGISFGPPLPVGMRGGGERVVVALADVARLRSLLVEARDALRAEEIRRVRDCERAGSATGHGYSEGHACHGSLAALLRRIDDEVGPERWKTTTVDSSGRVLSEGEAHATVGPLDLGNKP